MALIGMAFGVGFTFGPVIGALSVGDAAGGNLSVAPGFVAAGLSLIALILAATLLPETRPPGELPRRPWFNLEGWRLTLGHRSTAFPLLTFFMATVAFASFEGTVARYARDQLGFTIDKMGWLFAYFGFILMLTQGFIVRRMVTKVGEVGMSIAGVVLMLAGLVAVGLALPFGLLTFDPATVAEKLDLLQVLTSPDYLYVLVTMAVAVVGFACLTPSAQALVSRRTSALQQGEVLGVNQAAAAIARILGPLIGSVLYGTKEDPRHSWPFFAGAVLLGIALLFAIAMREPDNRPG
jgi:MFS family permease